MKKENEQHEKMRKKEQMPERVYYTPKIDFLERNVVRTREANPKKIRFSASKQRKRKNMKAKSPSNGPLLTPLPCPPRPKNQIFPKENRPFTTGTSGRFFCGFWRLLGRLKKRYLFF